jgi:hypothetical protein
MREIRPYGSEGGEARKGHPYPYRRHTVDGGVDDPGGAADRSPSCSCLRSPTQRVRGVT